MTASIRRLHADDLEAILQIQAAAYPELAESPAAIADRLLQAPNWCWGAEHNGVLSAYLLTHPWRQPEPPLWNTALPLLPAQSACLYIHDLALASMARGSGVATRLIGAVLQRARHARFTEAQLIAVQGSQTFWQRQGFQPTQAQGKLADTLASYGADTQMMWRRL